MTFRYFAYGSNLWLPRMRGRCPSARLIGTAVLRGWTAVYDKPSRDGMAKLNIRPLGDGTVWGVVYEIETHERARLDTAEPRYEPIDTTVGLAYAYGGPPTTATPAEWYVAIVEAGARSHGLVAPARGRQPDP